MQRTDKAEHWLEMIASVPLAWENVFRSAKYTDRVDKEVIDLLFVLRNKGIFVSMKCQQNPESRSRKSQNNWVQKNAVAALKQIKGGIKTSKSREIWCNHHRRGRVSFKPSQIQPIHAIVIIESYYETELVQNLPLAVKSIPVTYLSLGDFVELLIELRTFNDLHLYLKSRSTICTKLQRTIGIESFIFKYYVLNRASLPGLTEEHLLKRIVCKQSEEIKGLMKLKKGNDLQAKPLERVSNDLSGRLEEYDVGLNQEYVDLFDSDSKRRNYLLIQDELCDLVLDERRKIGLSLSGAVTKVRSSVEDEVMMYQAAHLDSKPDFLYVLSASKNKTRNNIVDRGLLLIQSGLAHFGKARGLLIHYNLDIDNFDTIMSLKRTDTPEIIQLGKEFYSHLKMADVPIEKL